MCTCPLHQELRSIFNQRITEEVRFNLDNRVGVTSVAHLRGKRIPVSVVADIARAASAKQRLRFGAMLARHGAVVVP